MHMGKAVLAALLLVALAGCQSKRAAPPTASHHASSARAAKPVAQRSSPPPKPKAKPTPPTFASAVTTPLTQAVAGLAGTTSLYLGDPATGQTWTYHNGPQRSASTIKLFVLGAAFAQAQAGRFALNATYVLQASDKVGGTGTIQGLPAGTTLTRQALLTKMIQVSDNTATNIIITQLGGFGVVNAFARSIGATHTVLARKMLDTAALARGIDNRTTVADTGLLLTKLANHRLVSASADSAMLTMLAGQTNRSKLAAGAGSGITVYNKTGEYDQYGVENDAAIFRRGQRQRVIVMMSQGGTLSAQIPAFNAVGRLVAGQLQ